MAKVKKKKKGYIWVVAYIDNEQIEKTEEYLGRYPEYRDIVAFIPTVKILKKTFKNKNEFENVPLLFNYGFFKIPKSILHNQEFFSTLKERIPVIYHWVKDTAGALSVKPRFRMEGSTKKEYVPYAIATDEEIAEIARVASETTIYDGEDLKNIQPGSFIVLKGYPWEDMQAEILSIDEKKEEVKVRLIIEKYMKEVTVSFHNVFYTIYRGGHKVESPKEKSIEELSFKKRSMINSLDIDL